MNCSKKLYENDFEAFLAGMDTKGLFVAAYPADGIPDFGSMPTVAIINTAPLFAEGEHWIPVYVENKTIEFFDSYGRRPSEINEYISNFASRFDVRSSSWNDISFQDENSEICGYYCLFFLLRKMKGVSLNDIKCELQQSGNSDEYVERVVKEIYAAKERELSCERTWISASNTYDCLVMPLNIILLILFILFIVMFISFYNLQKLNLIYDVSDSFCMVTDVSGAFCMVHDDMMDID